MCALFFSHATWYTHVHVTQQKAAKLTKANHHFPPRGRLLLLLLFFFFLCSCLEAVIYRLTNRLSGVCLCVCVCVYTGVVDGLKLSGMLYTQQQFQSFDALNIHQTFTTLHELTLPCTLKSVWQSIKPITAPNRLALIHPYKTITAYACKNNSTQISYSVK